MPSLRIRLDIVDRLREKVLAGPTNDEQRWLLHQFKELNEEGVWWSDAEYEWFINRVVTHLGQDESQRV